MYMNVMKALMAAVGMCFFLFIYTQNITAGKTAAQTRFESRLEENVHTMRLENNRPGLRCMLLTSGESPLHMEPMAAVQWHCLGMGPILPGGIIKEIQKPFTYSLGSAVLQEPAGFRLDFSLNPGDSFGSILLGSKAGSFDRSGVFVEKDSPQHRAGAWLEITSGKRMRYSLCVYGSLLPEHPEEKIDEMALQGRYPSGVQGRRFNTYAFELQRQEADSECSILTAVILSPVGIPALYGRGYLRFGSAIGKGRFRWQAALLGRCAGDKFTNAEGQLPEEEASLEGRFMAGTRRNSIQLQGQLCRHKLTPVPERYVACGRKGGAELQCGFLWFDGRIGGSHECCFDEEGHADIRSDCEAEIAVSREQWEFAVRSTGRREGMEAVEYRHKFCLNAEIGNWGLNGVLDLEERLHSYSGSIRGEYERDELCLWAKLGWEFDPDDGLETPLSLGMKLEHSEIQ